VPDINVTNLYGKPGTSEWDSWAATGGLGLWMGAL
jgi:hypothetical protein